MSHTEREKSPQNDEKTDVYRHCAFKKEITQLYFNLCVCSTSLLKKNHDQFRGFQWIYKQIALYSFYVLNCKMLLQFQLFHRHTQTPTYTTRLLF